MSQIPIENIEISNVCKSDYVNVAFLQLLYYSLEDKLYFNEISNDFFFISPLFSNKNKPVKIIKIYNLQ